MYGGNAIYKVFFIKKRLQKQKDMRNKKHISNMKI